MRVIFYIIIPNNYATRVSNISIFRRRLKFGWVLSFLYRKDIQGTMGQLSSKLHKNKNNSNTYQIYLLKLHENILKYHWLNLFKEIDIGFNHNLWTTSVFLAASLFKLVNAAVIVTFSFSLVLYEVLLVSRSTAPHI